MDDRTLNNADDTTVETAMVDGLRRRRTHRSRWIVTERRRPTLWSRLVSWTLRHNADAWSPEIETRGRP